MITLFTTIPILTGDSLIPKAVTAVADSVADSVRMLSIKDWFVDLYTDLLQRVLGLVIGAITSVLGWLFLQGTREFLFFAPPGAISDLQGVWYDVVFLYPIGILFAGLSYFVMMQLFPESTDTSIYQFLERTLAASLLLVVMSPAIQYKLSVPKSISGGDIQTFDLFSIMVLGLNAVGEFLFPETYSLVFLQDSVNTMMGLAAQGFGLTGTIVAVVYLGTTFVVAIIAVVAAFYLMLSLRMVLIYVVYALMPLLLGLWLIDVGPLKYASSAANLVFKLTAVLFLLGIVISGILATTGAIAGQSADSNLEFLGQGQYNDTLESPDPSDRIVINNGTEINDSLLDTVPDGMGDSGGGSASSESSSDFIGTTAQGGETQTQSLNQVDGLSRVIIQTFAWLGGIVLSISITMSMIGLVVSMKGKRAVKSRVRQGRQGAGQLGTAYYGASGDTSGGMTGGGGGGSPTLTSDGDNTVIEADEEEGLLLNQNAVEPENTDGVSLREKAGYIGRKGFDGAADRAGLDGKQTRESVAESVQKGRDAIPRPVGQPVRKLGSLAYRGGSATKEVWKEQTVMDSHQRAKQILAESPIGHPDKKAKNTWFSGVREDETSTDAFNTGNLKSIASLDELHDNIDEIEGERVNINQVDLVADDDDIIKDKNGNRLQVGTFRDEEGTKAGQFAPIGYIDGMQQLQEGNYNLRGVEIDQYKGEPQIKIDEKSGVNRQGDKIWATQTKNKVGQRQGNSPEMSVEEVNENFDQIEDDYIDLSEADFESEGERYVGHQGVHMQEGVFIGENGEKIQQVMFRENPAELMEDGHYSINGAKANTWKGDEQLQVTEGTDVNRLGEKGDWGTKNKFDWGTKNKFTGDDSEIANIDEIKNNFESYKDKRVSLGNVEFEHTKFKQKPSLQGDKEVQKGVIQDEDGNRIEATVGDTQGHTTSHKSVSDGQYNFENVRVRVDKSGKPHIDIDEKAKYKDVGQNNQ